MIIIIEVILPIAGNRPFLRVSRVLFHIEGLMKESMWPLLIVHKEHFKIRYSNYLMFLNCSDKLIQILHSNNWGIDY